MLISEIHLTKSSVLKILDYEIIKGYHPDGTAHEGDALIISNTISHHPHPPYTSINF